MFGDGASNQGNFGETMNLAALWSLPVVFMVENNLYGMGTALERHSAVTDLSKKAEGFGVPGVRVDGMDVLAMRETCRRAHLRIAREERRPTLVEAFTYRFRGHSAADPEVYRDEGGGRGVARARPDRDLRATACSRRRCSPSRTSRRCASEATRSSIEAVEFADASPEPAARLALRRPLRARRPGAGLVRGRRALARRRIAARTSARPPSGARTSSPRRGAAYAAEDEAARARPRATEPDDAGPEDVRLMAVDALCARRCDDAMARGDAPRRDRLRDGRGRRRLPGRLQGHRGAARGVRREARARHADLREHDRRHGRRRGDGRPAPGRRADDGQLRAARDGPDRQPRRARSTTCSAAR